MPAIKYSKTTQCIPMTRLQNVLNGKWKIIILWYLSTDNVRRFGELRRQIKDISESTLTKQLRELETDGFVSRHIYQEIPPKVEYSLTDLGKSFIPVLEHMMSWSEHNLCPDYRNAYSINE